MPTEKMISNLIINKVENKEVYKAMVAAGQVNDDEIYLVEGEEASVGKNVEGQTFTSRDGTTVTAAVGAEIFNDYRDATYETWEDENGESITGIATGNMASGEYSHAEGSLATASGDTSHAEGKVCTASGEASHAEGNLSKAIGYSSHAEGYNTTASGDLSHAEGFMSTASGETSHTEGALSISSGYASHAEGCTTASGDYSHAENAWTTASGDYSHAEGEWVTASSECQHVQGKYNVDDSNGTYAHIVGNGADGALSNAHTLDWSGNAWFAGDVYVGSTSGTNKDEGSSKLVTEAAMEAYINEAILGGEW